MEGACQHFSNGSLRHTLLAPTGALVLMMVYYISAQLFQIFTQSFDAIDVTSVTLLESLKQYQCK